MVLVIAYWWWSAHARKTPGKQVFTPASIVDQVEYAAANARSWRVTTVGTMQGRPFQSDQDVLCPSDSHTVTHVTDVAGASSVAEEFIQTKDTLYAREANEAWQSQPKTAEPCRTGPMAGPASLLDTLENLKRQGIVRRGDLLGTAGASCRVWDFYAAGGLLGSICVDDETHLPYDVKVGTLRVQYSNWNMPLIIEPPPGATH